MDYANYQTIAIQCGRNIATEIHRVLSERAIGPDGKNRRLRATKQYRKLDGSSVFYFENVNIRRSEMQLIDQILGRYNWDSMQKGYQYDPDNEFHYVRYGMEDLTDLDECSSHYGMKAFPDLHVVREIWLPEAD